MFDRAKFIKPLMNNSENHKNIYKIAVKNNESDSK